ncbi:MAG: hypothetical protein KDA53_07120 [Hyphomonas sp.]|nr:hypothetical protein [Hyphomonas sp.]
MKYLLTGVAAVAMLTGCAKKDKPGSADAPAGIVFSQEKIPEYTVHKGDSATASQALDAFSLGTSGSGRLTWASKDVKGDTATFTDVVIKGDPEEEDEGGMSEADDSLDLDGADVRVKKLQLQGLAMQDGQASFSRLMMDDVSLVPQDPEEAKNGSGTIGSIELVNPSPETAAWVAGMFGEGEEVEMPEGKALSFDHWAVKDVDFQIHEEEGDQGEFTLGEVVVTHLQDEKASLMKVSKFNFDLIEAESGNKMKMTLGNFEIRGADLQTLDEARDEAADPTDVKGMMKLSSQDPANPGYESVALNGFSMDMAGVKLDVPKLASAVGRNKAGTVVAVKTDPFKVTLATGEGELGEQLAGPLAMMGYETVELSGAGYQTYEPATDVTTYVKGQNYWEVGSQPRARADDTRTREELLARAKQLGLTVGDKISDADLQAQVAKREAGGFKVDLAMKFAGARAMMVASEQQNLDAQNPAAALNSTIDNMILHNFELSFDDDGFVDRAFNAYATMNGEDPKVVRNQAAGLLAMAPLMAASTGIDAELIGEATSALSSFISDPKTLTIKLAPKEPVSVAALADLEDPAELTKEKLGFAASNK